MTATIPKTRPPLESGDHLTPDEFWHLYSERHDLRKAELIGGTVYAPSPVYRQHAQPHNTLGGWIAAYAAQHGLYAANDQTTFLTDEENVQPDVLLLAREGSTAMIDDDGYVRGAPDLVVEIAASSASYDLHVKKDAYEAAGVREYVVWRTYDRAVD